MAGLKVRHAAESPQLTTDVLTALEAHPAFETADTVLLYHSLPDEVSTHAFVQKWSTLKRVLLPVVVGSDLELRLYTSPEDLKPGTYGILEPVGEAFADYEAVQFVAVPGVAFDRQGNRLGRGKGYYDRLLPLLTNAFRAGVCFPYQLVEEVPAEPFDVRMHCVIAG